MIKVVIMFIKKYLKTQKKLKELEIMYQNTIYICISWYSKICWFPVKKHLRQHNSGGFTRDLYIFWSSLVKYKCPKFHHFRIWVAGFREGAWGLFGPPFHPWAAPKRPILNWVKQEIAIPPLKEMYDYE